jgi:uncharacterized protein (TIGR02145 family)
MKILVAFLQPLSIIILISFSIIVYAQNGSFNCGDNLTDSGDGQIYKTVMIGPQCWFKENLRTSKYKDGIAIPLVTDITAWSELSTPGYCYYNNDSASYKNTYGGLYNWFAVNTGNLCPTGWHVPDTIEWNTLGNYLGGRGGLFDAGGKMKEAYSKHWPYPNTGATNSSGFTALPGGIRNSYDGKFFGLGGIGDWWSATEGDAATAWDCIQGSNGPGANLNNDGKANGFSVRCIKD